MVEGALGRWGGGAEDGGQVVIGQIRLVVARQALGTGREISRGLSNSRSRGLPPSEMGMLFFARPWETEMDGLTGRPTGSESLGAASSGPTGWPTGNDGLATGNDGLAAGAGLAAPPPPGTAIAAEHFGHFTVRPAY